MNKAGFLLQVLLLSNAQQFTAEAKLSPSQCIQQEKFNEDGKVETFYICPNQNSKHHLCYQFINPFDTWFHNVTIFKSSSDHSNATALWENKTLLGDCDPTWKEDFFVKYRYCNSSTSDRTPRVQNNGLVEPSYFQIIIWIMAIVSVVGNMIVFVNSFLSLKRKFSSMSEVEKVHHILLVNLALADFLMGIYLLSIAILAIVFGGPRGRLRLIMSLTPFCNFLGVLCLISSQMSVTVLVLMTSFRLNSVLRPFNAMNAMTSVAAVACCWMAWTVLACLPLFDEEFIRSLFESVVLRSCNKHNRVALFSYRNVRQMLDGFLESVRASCPSISNHSLWLSDSVQGSHALSIAQHLKLANDKPLFLSYYSKSHLCTPAYFFHALSDSLFFGMLILVFNFVSFFYMLVAYWYIWFKSSGSKSCLPCKRGSNGANAIGEREKENRRLIRKVLLIIATDFLCWMPTCVLGFWYTAFAYDPQVPRVCDAMLSLVFPRAVFTTIVLPINSALNPILYSAVPRAILKRIFRRVRCSSDNSRRENAVKSPSGTKSTNLPLSARQQRSAK